MRRHLLLTASLLAFTGFTACDDAQSTDSAPIGTDEALVSETGGLLPAGMTAGERQGKADGEDPRDAHSDYRFTGTPGDILEMPGEFEGVQLLFVGYTRDAVQLERFFVDLIDAAHLQTHVVVFYDDASAAGYLQGALQDAGSDISQISFAQVDLDSIWMRDYGPLVARTTDGYFRVVDPRYYYGRFADDVFPTVLADAWQLPVSRPPLELEGGNFQSDGQGRCITTEWAVDQNYLFGYRHDDIEEVFRDYLGCDTTAIVPAIEGEGTGHVDMLATITGPGEVIVGRYERSEDPVNAALLDEAADRMEDAGFFVRRVPMPTNVDGNYRSYTNSLAVNNVVLVPTYSDDNRFEAEALDVFERAYPGKTIVAVDSTDIIRWSGAVHCVTMTIGN